MKSCFFKRMFINNRILYDEFLKGMHFMGVNSLLQAIRIISKLVY